MDPATGLIIGSLITGAASSIGGAASAAAQKQATEKEIAFAREKLAKELADAQKAREQQGQFGLAQMKQGAAQSQMQTSSDIYKAIMQSVMGARG